VIRANKYSAIMDSSEPDSDIDVQIAVDYEAIDVSLSRLRELVVVICKRFAEDTEEGTSHQVSVAIVGDAKIRELNNRFLDHRSTTDCLSFDLSDAGAESKTFELIVNGQMAVRQAASRGHSSEAELALYVTHGLLHNLGFDDSTASLARKMHETEDDILQQLGYGLVYNTGTRTPEH